MSESVVLMDSPLADIDYHFADYLSKKKSDLSKRMDGNGLPNYAYLMDYEYRKKLDSIPGLFKMAKAVCSSYVPQALQEYNMNGVLVGPNQFPEIYQIAGDCAKILGIGIPNILVVPDIGGAEFNACTYAYDDQEPVILVTGLMVQRTSLGELKAVIGHECGHIHNYHGVYNTLSVIVSTIGMNGILAIPGIRQLVGLSMSGINIALKMWSRAAEVTADRAGLICCEHLEDAYNVNKKLIYGGANLAKSVDVDLNIEALKEQVDMIRSNPVRFNELTATHPLSVKRIFAEMEFANCETLYEWRPDLKKPGQRLYSKKETDEKVKKYIDVVKGKGGK